MNLDLILPIFVVLAFQLSASLAVSYFLKREYLKAFKKWSYIGFILFPLAFPFITIMELYWPLIKSGTLDAASIAVNIDLVYFLIFCLILMGIVQFLFNTFILERIALRKK